MLPKCHFLSSEVGFPERSFLKAAGREWRVRHDTVSVLENRSFLTLVNSLPLFMQTTNTVPVCHHIPGPVKGHKCDETTRFRRLVK